MADKLTFTLDTGDGENKDVVIKLRPDLAPGHVERITELVGEGFYDGVVFHRVIPGFMAQGGDPTGTGMGGSDKPDLKAEFNSEPHTRGTCSMARTQVPDSANSQFFICFAPSPFLDGQYTAFGRVIEGMQHVDSIKRGDQRQNGKVSDPDRIVRLRVAGMENRDLALRDLNAAEKTKIIQAIKQNLKDPNSALFKLGKVDQEISQYCGMVNAKNSYGGYTGDVPFLAAISRDSTSVNATLIALGTVDPESAKSEAVYSMCANSGYDASYFSQVVKLPASSQ